MRRAWIAIAACWMLGGCMTPAATTHDLLAADAIVAAAGQARTGVAALSAAVAESDRLRQEQMLADLRASILIVAGQSGPTTRPDESPELLAGRIVDALRTHQANYRTNDARRRELLAATLDNLDYIVEVAQAGRQFALYRADVGEQMRAYIEAARRPAGVVGDVGAIEQRIDACPFMDESEKSQLRGLLGKLSGLEP